MLSCQMDTDCVGVAANGCCQNGSKVAVAASQADAYKRSFTCAEPHPICPMIRILDTRSAECNNATHQCEMVAADKIQCGGFIRNHHACPDGYRCQPRGPDIPGACVK